MERVDSNWRSRLTYLSNGKIVMPDNVLDHLCRKNLIDRPEIRIGESMGNCLICGIGEEWLTLNVNPHSSTKRFTLEERGK